MNRPPKSMDTNEKAFDFSLDGNEMLLSPVGSFFSFWVLLLNHKRLESSIRDLLTMAEKKYLGFEGNASMFEYMTCNFLN